jgi:hypothetical protein
MKTSTLTLSIATLAFGASTIYLAQRLHEELAHSDQVSREVGELNARIAELEKARAEPRFAQSGVFGAIDTPPGTVVSALPPPPPAPGKSEPRADRVEAVVVNGPPMPPRGEAFQKMIRSQMRAQNKQIYADVGAQLGLSKQEASKLIDLLTDQQASGIAISHDTTDATERMRLMNEARRENEAKVAELLGPEKLALLEQYQQTIPVRQELEMLSRQLEGSDAAPLSDDQRKRMLAALLEERKRIPTPNYSSGTAREDFAKAYVAWQDDYNARVADQARGILNSEQYAAYDEYQQLQKEMREQAQAHMIAGPRGGVVFSAAAPGTVIGETAILTTAPASEEKDKEP